MRNNDVFTFHIKKSIARGALYVVIFISMVDHAVTLIYDPEGRLERLYRKESVMHNASRLGQAKLVAGREPQSISCRKDAAKHR